MARASRIRRSRSRSAFETNRTTSPISASWYNVPRSGGVSARRWGGDDASTGAHSGRSPSKLWKAQAEVSVRLKQRANKRSSAGVRRDEIRQKPGPYIGQSTVPHSPGYGASIATATLIRSHRNPPPWRSASRPMCAGPHRADPWSEPPTRASRRSARGRVRRRRSSRASARCRAWLRQ
jgi:hypothetical protein